MQIKQFAALTGVSVRTLHYYDEIGLLKPEYVDEHNGYRYYGEQSLKRISEILFYRELDFSLKAVSEILSLPNYDRQTALKGQRELLILKRNRLDRLITALDDAGKGQITMQVFDNSEYEKALTEYKAEAEKKWGKTDEYRQFSEKTKDYGDEKWCEVNAGMDIIFGRFARVKAAGFEPGSDEAKAVAEELQNYITQNCYNCDKQILSCLGEMYVSDERFKENIDRHAQGTADFASKAIKAYCG
ncbi:MAG: MerR family transcriptional regulator [Acutalibacteraceae bacterium]